MDEKNKTVIFIDQDEDYETLGKEVTEQTAKIKGIMENLKGLRDQIDMSKAYHKRLVRSQDFGLEMDYDY